MNGRLPLEWDRKFGRKSLLTVGAGDPFERSLAQRACGNPRLKFHASQPFALCRINGVLTALDWVEGNLCVGGFCKSRLGPVLTLEGFKHRSGWFRWSRLESWTGF